MAQGERLTAYERHADFPPPHIGEDNAACARWYAEVFAGVPMAEPDPATTPRERRLCRLSASEYIELRRSGGVTCEEYCTVLVKRARYYRYLNQWMASVYDRLDLAIGAARQLDEKAAAEGVEAIAPLYGLCIPMKGTAAVVDFPSGSGSGVLSGYTPVADSELTQLIRERGGVILGTTNGTCSRSLAASSLKASKKQLRTVPEFAAGWVTANPCNGTTRNPYDHKLTVGGSSGGSASAVASYMCAIAVTEDTGGSTRVPATSCGNFGYDPSRNHFPNAGNPGMSFTQDQLGINTRSVEDVILFDRALTAHGPAEAVRRTSIAGIWVAFFQERQR